MNSSEESRYYLILTQDLGYARTGVHMGVLEEASRLLNAYAQAILAPDFRLPYPAAFWRDIKGASPWLLRNCLLRRQSVPQLQAALWLRGLVGADREMHTAKDVAEHPGINEKQVYRLIKEKTMPANRVAGKWLFPKNVTGLGRPWHKRRRLSAGSGD